MDKMKCSTLHADVVPFIPKQHPNTHREASVESNKSPLSPNVAEFVPSWLQRETVASSQKACLDDSKLTDCSNSLSKPSFTKKKKTNIEKSDNHSSPSICQPSLITDDLKKPSKTNIKKHTILRQPTNNPNQDFISNEKEGSISDHKDNIDSEFPALGSTVQQDQRLLEKYPAVGKMQHFAISFSEKLKSSNWNKTMDYKPDKTAVTEQKPTNKHNSKKKEYKNPMENKTAGNSPSMQSGKSNDSNQEMKLSSAVEIADGSEEQFEDNGFHVVKNKAKRRITKRDDQNDEDGPGNEMGQTKATSFKAVKFNQNEKEDENGLAEDRLKNSKRYNSKRFSENRNVGDPDGSKEQRGTYGNRPSNSGGYSSDPDWRKRPEKSSSREVRIKNGKERIGVERKNIPMGVGQVGKHEETEWDFPKLDSTGGKQDNRPEKSRLKNSRTLVHRECSDRKPENTKKEQLKIKITVGKAYVDNALTTDSMSTRAQFSYSDALKCKAKVQLPEPRIVEESQRGVLRIPQEESDQNEEGNEPETKTKKKKKKKKKKSTENPQAVKKTKEPIMFDFGDMLAKLEEKTIKTKPVIQDGGSMPAQAPLPPKESQILDKPKVYPQFMATKEAVSNSLDSTAPIVFRGKEREAPKKKKPSAMRKILTKEREEKKLLYDEKSLPDATAGNEDADEDCDDVVDDEDSEKSTSTFPDEIKKSIHSRKFREYCDHDLDYNINGVVITLLKELIRFQDRLYLRDPVKAKAKRRFVCGLREVFKHANLKRLKCVIVTPNMEPTKSKGGLDDLLSNIITVCHSQNVPVVFALNRQILGKVLLKKVPVSVAGIFYYDGAQNYFKSLMELTKIARETYKDKFEAARQRFLSEKKREADDSEVSDGHENAKQLKTSENEHAGHGEKSTVTSEMLEWPIAEVETTLPATKTSTSKMITDSVKHADGNVTVTTVSCNTETVMFVCENKDHTPDVPGVQAGKHQRNVVLGTENVEDDEASVNEETKPFFARELKESSGETSVMSVFELEINPSSDVAGVQAGNCAVGKHQGNVGLGISSETKTDCIEDGEPTGNEGRVEAFLADERVSCNTGTVTSRCELQESHGAVITAERERNVALRETKNEKADLKQVETSVNEELESFLADENVSCNTGTVTSLREPVITELERNFALETSQSENEKADPKHGETSVNEELEPLLAYESVSCIKYGDC